ncbi:tyrosine-protein phosphatase [Rhizorhabdus argentea]|uniref:tyrosine-protein phosphatase n=1 Tax=Rhizorhabdus argentea TaxID=1387174 RepID=UPI0030EF5C2D
MDDCTAIDGGPVANRIIPLSGGHNFRDIGGYRTVDGRTTAWGLVYRSGTMASLDASDHAVLDKLGLRTVCDFRSTAERTKRPSLFAPDAGFEVWARDYDMSSADFVAIFCHAEANQDRSRERMIALYHEIAEEQAPAYQELFRRLADGALPLVFHCSAGKDRTGVAAALLLDLLGVPRETIVEDYELTDLFIEKLAEIVRHEPIGDRLADIDPQIWAPMLRADAAYLHATFAMMEERFGSARGFLREVIGVDDDMAERIRARLLE